MGNEPKDNSNGLVLLMESVCMGDVFVGLPAQLQGTLTQRGLHHTAKARQAHMHQMTLIEQSLCNIKFY